jgi:hypothetical protein
MAELFSLMLFFVLCTMGLMDELTSCAGEPNLPAPIAPERRSISDRKLAANRRNAQLSTGPRTAHGKARAAMNSSKHEILSRAPLALSLVIPKLEGRRATAQFRAMMVALIADRDPVGAVELLMVQEIAGCAWRLRRLLKFENRTAFLKSVEWKEDCEDDPELESNQVLEKTGLNELSLPDPDDVTMITRYESALKRHLFRAIDQLERMQRSRRRAADAECEKSPRSHASDEIFEHLHE